MDNPSDTEQDITSGFPPPDFVDTVRLLLEHLYDLPFIQQHPLASHPVVRQQQTAETPSQNLRAVLMSAIDAFKLSVENVSKPPNRYYNLVYLHYVDGMTIQEAAHQLGVSLRQAYRDLQRGIESVASLLWEQLSAFPSGSDAPDHPALMSVHSEVARLVPNTVKTELGTLLEYAGKAVQRLAAQKGIALEVNALAAPVSLYTDIGIAQQALVRVLSQVIQAVETQVISVKSTHDSRVIQVQITPCPKPVAGGGAVADVLSTRLLNRLGWSVEAQPGPDCHALLNIIIPTDLRVLLVIDDNEGMAELLERYLTAMPYRVTAATSAAEGLRLAHDLAPNIIMLDIMMPEMDGWELLQRLHNNPETSRIPIIVCSVFNDPELAFSLGATAFLPKPLSRDLLLEALLRVQFSGD